MVVADNLSVHFDRHVLAVEVRFRVPSMVEGLGFEV